ncbi:hypothetical protein TrLO_g8327 [Triparma laevis f. longispina]|uniref:C2 domain-containing protein n=1 Tax=Triparma laevis f. longispina TaxID=1714387 RepID=A0A9W7F3Y9_9STRA|nr:hypothetical protein TrLO_g8327 [Triparma laevis f. longispina]
MDSKYAGQRLCIPKSSLKTKIIKTLPQNYETAWFMEDAKEATRTWRCYTGDAKMSYDGDDHKTAVTKWIEVEHSDEKCWSGIRSLKLKFPGLEPGDFVRGGTCADCELKEDRLFIFRARVYHEWHEEEYELQTKSVSRDVLVTKNLYGDLVTPKWEPPETPVIEEDGGWVVNVEYSEPQSENEPLLTTTTNRYKNKPPTAGFARIGVWDKGKVTVWSDEDAQKPLNKWHTIQCQMIGTATGRGKVFIHCAEGFQGCLYIDDVEVIWGGPTETERMVDKVVNACEITHSSHTEKMRIGLCDARELSAVDWGGTSDPYATVSITRGKEEPLSTEEVLKSPVVYGDCFPVWNCDNIEVVKPIPPPIVSSIDKEEAKMNKSSEAYKKATNHAVEHEMKRFKEMRNEGMSVKEATKIAKKERIELIQNFKSVAGDAELKADRKDPNKFSVRIEINDYDLVGDDDFLGEVVITKRQLFNSAKHSHKVYFPVAGEIGEGRQKRPASGKVAVIVRLHEWHDPTTKWGGVVKTLMTGTGAQRDKAIHFCMQTFNLELSLMDELKQLIFVMQEPVVEELVCHISDARRCEGACMALMGLLGKRGPRQKKTWGFLLRKALQERIIRCGGADACAEGTLSWDTGSNKLRRKAACLELLAQLLCDNKARSAELVRENHRILIATVAGLQMTEREGDLEGKGSYDDDICCARISLAARKLIMDIQYEDELDDEVIKVFWRIRRHIPLEDGLWRSPALQKLGDMLDDMPDEDELKELVDMRNMRRAGAWKKALSEWGGGEDAGIYCAQDLGGLMVADGLLLLTIVAIGYCFEFSVRIMNWEKSPFVFSPLLLILGAWHIGLYGWGWYKWNESFPAMDYTWTFTSEDEENAPLNPQWGTPTPAPTAAGTYGGYGCQQELLWDYLVTEGAVGAVGLVWFCLLYRLMTHVPKVVDVDEMKNKVLEAQKGGVMGGAGLDVEEGDSGEFDEFIGGGGGKEGGEGDEGGGEEDGKNEGEVMEEGKLEKGVVEEEVVEKEITDEVVEEEVEPKEEKGEKEEKEEKEDVTDKEMEEEKKRNARISWGEDEVKVIKETRTEEEV